MTKPGEKLKVRNLFKLVQDDYEVNEQASHESVDHHIKRLAPWFGHLDLPDVNKAVCIQYVKHRRAARPKPENSTINRELAVLKRGFSLYREDHQDFPMPCIPTLDENPGRKLAYTAHQYEMVMKNISPVYAGPIMFAYYSSWREGVILDLQWGLNVPADLSAVYAQGMQTKNGEGNVIPLDVFPFTELRELLLHRREQSVIPVGPYHGNSYVFHNGSGEKLTKSGLIKALARAHRDAKIPYGRKVKGGLTFHDFKKSAIRNMLREYRIPIDIVQKISGNLTRETFDKNYNNAIDEHEIREAFRFSLKSSIAIVKDGGEGGIRTPETNECLPDFESSGIRGRIVRFLKKLSWGS